MRKVYIIKCNDLVEAVHVGYENEAKDKLDEIRQAGYDKYEKNVGTNTANWTDFDDVYIYNFYEIQNHNIAV